MNATLKEWVSKAEGDDATAARELRATETPNYDAVCFYAQQCVEKLMKALLIQAGVIPSRTHDLTSLSQLLGPACPEWSWPAQELRFLTRAGVEFRYPGESANFEEASDSFTIVTRLRVRLRSLLGISE
ncbi:MAG TPA: HEPN domain-containing protein [Terriglobia bacterium]|nr:HEPN domain-containing protein [Terriglobia bacterium]